MSVNSALEIELQELQRLLDGGQGLPVSTLPDVDRDVVAAVEAFFGGHGGVPKSDFHPLTPNTLDLAVVHQGGAIPSLPWSDSVDPRRDSSSIPIPTGRSSFSSSSASRPALLTRTPVQSGATTPSTPADSHRQIVQLYQNLLPPPEQQSAHIRELVREGADNGRIKEVLMQEYGDSLMDLIGAVRSEFRSSGGSSTAPLNLDSRSAREGGERERRGTTGISPAPRVLSPVLVEPRGGPPSPPVTSAGLPPRKQPRLESPLQRCQGERVTPTRQAWGSLEEEDKILLRECVRQCPVTTPDRRREADRAAILEFGRARREQDKAPIQSCYVQAEINKIRGSMPQ